MGTNVGKKNVATKGSNHGAVAPGAISLVTPPAPPVPTPFVYVARSVNASGTTSKLLVDRKEVLVKGSTMSLDEPANQPAQSGGGDVVTHGTSSIAVMSTGSVCFTVDGKEVCGVGDIALVNVLNKNMKVAQMRDAGAAAMTSPFRLLGQYADEETGLCYTRFRYFEAGTGGGSARIRWELRADGTRALLMGAQPSSQIRWDFVRPKTGTLERRFSTARWHYRAWTTCQTDSNKSGPKTARTTKRASNQPRRDELARSSGWVVSPFLRRGSRAAVGATSTPGEHGTTPAS